MTFVCYILAVLGFAYVAGQSRITQRIRTVLARILVVSKEDRDKRCPCGGPLLWIPAKDFATPEAICRNNGAHIPRTGQLVERYLGQVWADGYWYPLKWPVLLLECPACLSTWVGAMVAWLRPALASSVVPVAFAGVVPFALLTCGAVALLSFLAGIHGDQNV